MANYENQSQGNTRKVFIPGIDQSSTTSGKGRWVYGVSEETYKTYSRSIWNTCKKAQKHHQCKCPKDELWKCDGDCLICRFYTAGDTLSLDTPMTNADGDAYTLADVLPDKSSETAEDAVLDKIMLEQLLKRLTELFPEALQIIMLQMEGLSERAIEEKIGIHRTTFRSKMEKVRAILRKEFSDLL